MKKPDYLGAAQWWSVAIVAIVFAIVHLVYGEEVVFWAMFVISLLCLGSGYNDWKGL